LTQFPITKDGEALNVWLSASRGKGTQKVHRHQVYGPWEVKALRCVQPFSLSEEVGLIEEGEEASQQVELDLLTHVGYALNTVWNIDKHRRLPRLTWRTGRFFWEDLNASWRSHLTTRAVLSDGQVLGTYRRTEGQGRPDGHPNIRLAVHLDDDPYHRASELTATLERFYQDIGSWVLPRMFSVADGNEPPIMISFGPPAPQAHPCQGR
jgi:hypothetical protein